MIHEVQNQMKLSTIDRMKFLLLDYVTKIICRVYQTVKDNSLLLLGPKGTES